MLLCQSLAVELVITCDVIELWDHYGNKFWCFIYQIRIRTMKFTLSIEANL